MLDKIANFLLIVACIMVIAVGVLYIHKEIKVRQLLARMPKPIKVGQTVKIPEAPGKTTLVLELSPTCPHCVANAPLYRQLSTLPQIREGKVQVIIAMAAIDQQAAQAFVDRDGIPGKLIVAKGADKFFVSFLFHAYHSVGRS